MCATSSVLGAATPTLRYARFAVTIRIKDGVLQSVLQIRKYKMKSQIALDLRSWRDFKILILQIANE